MPAQTIEISDDQQYLWLNMLLGRICFDCLQNPKVLEMIADKFQRKLNAIRVNQLYINKCLLYVRLVLMYTFLNSYQK